MVSENTDSTRSDADSSASRLQFEWDGCSQPSTAVAEAVATATDREPTELEPVHWAIDADALNAIVEPGRRKGVRVSFRYEGVGVLVDSQHGIEIQLDIEQTDLE